MASDMRRKSSPSTEISERERQLLFTEDRRAHVASVIALALQNGVTVVTDRYLWSTLAYGALECDPAWLEAINAEFPAPTATFLIDVSPDWALRKVGDRGSGVELYEQREKLARIAENYRALAKLFPKIIAVSGERPIEEVHRDIVASLEKTMWPHGL